MGLLHRLFGRKTREVWEAEARWLHRACRDETARAAPRRRSDRRIRPREEIRGACRRGRRERGRGAGRFSTRGEKGGGAASGAARPRARAAARTVQGQPASEEDP